ncbi:MAG: biopolymer transporter ExbD [Cyanobacteria bacterium]|nr:biopolymer transporter ExbD [Cyanobacteriota bacterium]
MNLEDDFSFDSSEPLDVNILPLIDIIFTVLAFVILASISTTAVSKLDVSLPVAKRSQQTSVAQRISIGIGKNGLISYNGSTITPQRLQPILMQQLQASDAADILINADKDAKLGIVVWVLDVVKQWPSARVSIRTIRG